MQPNVDSAPSTSKSCPAPASAVIPGMAWIPAVTVEWSGSAIRAAGGWLGTSAAVRTAARRAFPTEQSPATRNGAKLDPVEYVLVAMPNEASVYLTDNGDERPVTLSMMRDLYAALDRAADGAGPDALAAHKAIMRIAEHLAGHGLRLGTH